MAMFGSTQGSGFDAWLRPFQEAMSAFQGATAPGPFPGGFGANPWSSAGAWFGGQPAAMNPGWAQGFGAGPTGGPFMSFFEQLSGLAQAQWQQLAAQATTGAMPEVDALGNWRALVESVGAKMAAAAGPFELGPMPSLDTSTLRDALATPPVGPMREHIERWQHAMLAQLDYQEAARGFSAQLGETMKLAQTHLRERLAARAQKNEPITSSRMLFDEWVEAGEQAWAERASGDEFVAALGRFTNAEMKVRAAMADQVNRVAESLGLPTRGEVNADHRRIAQLERETRRLRRELDALKGADAVMQAPPKTTVAEEAAKPQSKETASPQPVAARPARRAASKVAAKSASSRSAVSSPVARKTTGRAAKPARGKTAGTVLPVVTAPRALGAAAGKGNQAAARRRAEK